MKKFVWISVIAVLLAAFDEVIKFLILTRLPAEGSFVSSKILTIGLHQNFGIAFDLPVTRWLVLALTSVLILVFVWIIWKHFRTRPNIAAAAALVVAGALGNLFDRVFYGFTVDYLIFFERSAVNISDALILIGVIWIILSNRKPKLDH